MKRIPELQTARARQLRSGATPAERALWRALSRYRPRFTRQLAVGPYIVDFANREARLAIEVDGGQHADAAARDARRTRMIEEQGWAVLRLWNNDVLNNLDGSVSLILERCAERLGGTHPRPLPSREGRSRRPRSRMAGT